MLRSLDLALLRLLRTRGHAHAVELAVVRFSRSGEHGALWCALALGGAAADARRRRLWLGALEATLLSSLAGQLAKLAVRRARPALADLPALTVALSGRSFPSVHAATSFAAARGLSRPLPAAPVYAAAAAMTLSRPYLGLHYPSDSVAGALLGDAVARLTLQ